MLAGLAYPLAILTAILTALATGTFFAFSTFVTPALNKLAPPQALSAMQSINVVVFNPLFMGAFMGAAVCFVLLSLAVLKDLGATYVVLILIAAGLYVIGTFGVTMMFNVPLNNSLAVADPASAGAGAFWAGFYGSWQMWNHIRTAAGTLSLVVLIVAIAEMRRGAGGL